MREPCLICLFWKLVGRLLGDATAEGCVVKN